MNAIASCNATRRLLLRLVSTPSHTAVASVRTISWNARRLHTLGAAASSIQRSDKHLARVAFTFGGDHWTTGQQRAMATLPPHDDRNTKRNDDDGDASNTNAAQQKRHDDDAAAAKSIKAKLAADLATARSLSLQQVVNVPNVITFARILSTPYLAYLIIDAQYQPAVALLAVAGLSDWLDGYIARTYKQESIVGSFLDPFADKLLIGALSLSMLYSGLLPAPLVALVFGRDVLLVAGTFVHRLRTKDADSAFFDTSDSGAFEVQPTMLSKVNTALQIALFGLTLTNAAWLVPADPALHVLFGVVGATTFASGSEYLWSYVNQTGAFRPLNKRK